MCCTSHIYYRSNTCQKREVGWRCPFMPAKLYMEMKADVKQVHNQQENIDR